jgi:hypothetical protein
MLLLLLPLALLLHAQQQLCNTQTECLRRPLCT